MFSDILVPWSANCRHLWPEKLKAETGPWFVSGALANLAFGGADRKMLYIALRSDTYSKPVNVASLA